MDALQAQASEWLNLGQSSAQRIAAVNSPSKKSGGGSVGGGRSAVDDYAKQIQSITSANNAWSAQQAELQRDWQVVQNQKAMDFSAAEASKSRDWQKMMSDSAHQREVADLRAAGLNPVLSALGGNGAAVTSGATASGVTSAGAKGDTDESGASSLVGLLGSFLQYESQLQAMNTNAITNLAVADKYTAMEKYTSELSNQTRLTEATMQGAVSRFVAETGADASKVSAAIHAAAQRYGYDVSAMTQRDIQGMSATLAKELKELDFKNQSALNSQSFDNSSALSKQQYQQDYILRLFFPSNPTNMLCSVAYGFNAIRNGLDIPDIGAITGKSFASGHRGGGFSK